AAFIEDLTSFVDHLRLEKPFLVAQSMGGLSCLGFAVRNPDRVRGLVMANTFAGMRREVWLASNDELRRLVQSVWERRREDGVKPVSLMAVAQTLIPNARMTVVSGAGHSVYFEQPDVFNRLLLDFFAAYHAS